MICILLCFASGEVPLLAVDSREPAEVGNPCSELVVLGKRVAVGPRRVEVVRRTVEVDKELGSLRCREVVVAVYYP